MNRHTARCLNGEEHGEFVASDDDGFDNDYLALDVDELPDVYGYCARCKTALYFDAELQAFVFWAEANVPPHCVYCGRTMYEPQHYLDVSVSVTSYNGPHWHPVNLPDVPPAIAGPLCGPSCLLYAVLDSPELKDVFAR